MPKVIYKMGGVSADGYIVGPDGKFDWTVPDEELERFHNEQTRSLAGHLLGRRLYETMAAGSRSSHEITVSTWNSSRRAHSARASST